MVKSIAVNDRHPSMIGLPQQSLLHFVGIGGIGMSALACALKKRGYRVQGSDLSEGPVIEQLIAHGVQVNKGHHEKHVGAATHLVLSSAITMSNPEVKEALRRKLPLVKRGALLGELTKVQPTVGVTGSHGKTTTTSLIGKLLVAGNLDPVILSGGIMEEYGSNARLGDGEWLVAELDESDGSHQYAHMDVGVITNIDEEHMTFYKKKASLMASFQKFVSHINTQGVGIACGDDAYVRELAPDLQRPLLYYGFGEQAHVRLSDARLTAEGMVFDVRFPDRTVYRDVQLSLFGVHNLQNAGAALAVGFHLGLSEAMIRQALSSFQGVHRRFNFVGTWESVRFIDDYAHHPVEILAALGTARKLCKGKLYALCEPHRYTRLRDHFQEFSKAFLEADHVIVLPVYAAGETPLPNISSEKLADALEKEGKKAVALHNFEGVSDFLRTRLRKDDMVLCMGAGASSRLVRQLPESMRVPTVASSL